MKIPRAAILMFLASAVALGQQFEVHHQFVQTWGNATDRATLGADGNLYVLAQGGDYGRGQILRLVSNGAGGYSSETLYSFRGPEGFIPNTLMQGADGRLYGTSSEGGGNGNGTIFSFDPAVGLVVLYTFEPYGFLSRLHPYRLVQAGDGNFYGATEFGGANHLGSLYRLTPEGDFQFLSQMGGPEGIYPGGPLALASDGSLYGTTIFGGALGGGTLFRVDLSGTLTVLHDFDYYAEGGWCNGDLVQAADGYLYGTAQLGGASDSGTVFRSDLSGHVTLVHNFPSPAGEGTHPELGLTPAGDGALYGTTSNGGPGGGGTVFRILPNGDFEIVATFPNGDPAPAPAVPYWDLTPMPDGTLLGVTLNGGLQNTGVLYRVPLPQTGSFEVLAQFGTPSGVYQPTSGLTQTADGTLWGAAGGGAADKGTIYRLSGGPLIAHEFTGADGATPGSLLAASDGNLYGVTQSGGTAASGTVFRLDSAGTFTTLHDFSGPDGAQPEGGLMEADDGNFYGTTGFGGANGGGTLYRLTASGTHSKLHDFTANPVAEEPRGRILQASDGMLYFTGFGGRGTLYRSDLAGSVTDIHDFVGADGENPPGGVVQADDGNLYGTCFNAGNGTYGTVFRFTPPSTYAVIHDFDDVRQEGNPLAPLIQASDGRLYGTTPGTVHYGSVFSIEPGGTDFRIVHKFDFFPDGAGPVAPLMQASDGMLYGTTSGAGFSGQGNVFRLDLAGSPPSLSGVEPDSGLARGGVPLTILGDHLRLDAAVSIGGAPVALAYPFEAGRMFALTAPLLPGTLNDVMVTNGDGQSATLPLAYFADFLDAPAGSLFHDVIEELFRDGITAGCGGGSYCTDEGVTRAQMAVFLLKVMHGSSYAPPPCAGIFPDVRCPSLFADWIEELAAEGISAGCGGGLYCPDGFLPRANAAVFLLKAEHGNTYVPPPCTGVFDDVPCPSQYADWIEQLAAESVTGGCGNGKYCPDQDCTRGQMAAFLEKIAVP